jgi:hypothetical protein
MKKIIPPDWVTLIFAVCHPKLVYGFVDEGGARLCVDGPKGIGVETVTLIFLNETLLSWQ